MSVPDGQAVPVPPRLVVPAYFHPGLQPQQWQWLAEHPSRVWLVILNVASGPGTRPQRAFREAADLLRRAGVGVIGYIDTDYGHVPMPQAMAEAGRYQDWYGVRGMCLDRVAAGPEQVRYYAELAARIRAEDLDVVFFNHGTHPAEAYARHADLLGTFEGPWPAYQRLHMPRWTQRWAPEKFYHVVHSVPVDKLADARQLAVSRRAASVYITERSGPNPYDALPADYGLGDGRLGGRHRKELT